MNTWRNRAAVCRYGHVPLSQVLGRNLEERPLSALESALFTFAIVELLTAERQSPADATAGED